LILKEIKKHTETKTDRSGRKNKTNYFLWNFRWIFKECFIYKFSFIRLKIRDTNFIDLVKYNLKKINFIYEELLQIK
jgi:hypothetical protein